MDMGERPLDKAEAKRNGEHMRTLRESRGWSRRRLAEMSNISPTSIRQLEAGERADGLPFNPRPFTLRQVAFAFGTPDGPELLRLYEMADMADQLEREFMGLDDLEARVNSPYKRELIRRIKSLVIDLALEN